MEKGEREVSGVPYAVYLYFPKEPGRETLSGLLADKTIYLHNIWQSKAQALRDIDKLIADLSVERKRIAEAQ